MYPAGGVAPAVACSVETLALGFVRGSPKKGTAGKPVLLEFLILKYRVRGAFRFCLGS